MTILLSHGCTMTAFEVTAEVTCPPMPNVGSKTPALGWQRSSSGWTRRRLNLRRFVLLGAGRDVNHIAFSCSFSGLQFRSTGQSAQTMHRAKVWAVDHFQLLCIDKCAVTALRTVSLRVSNSLIRALEESFSWLPVAIRVLSATFPLQLCFR